MIILSLRVTEPYMWVYPPQEWILDLPSVGRDQESSSWDIHGGIRYQKTNQRTRSYKEIFVISTHITYILLVQSTY